MEFLNDEPTTADHLKHGPLVEQLANRIKACKAPYVMGISGGWGSGKTSFLKKLEAVLKKEFENDKQLNQPDGYFLLWFNPWHHQFETTPLVALLHEIRRSLSLIDRTKAAGKKIADVTIHTALNMMDTLGKAAGYGVPPFKTADIMKRGQEYETENFQTALTSQRFQKILQDTIAQVIGKNGKMIVFIDDLDRCEHDTTFKLLEALKLYLNTENCVYILGLDRHHLEGNVARALRTDDSNIHRVLAREYLGKMFQGIFLLPAPADTKGYIRALLALQEDSTLCMLLKKFGLPILEGPGKDEKLLTKLDDTELIATLDQILPHNPRKIKAFLSSWRMYLEVVEAQLGTATGDWRLTLVLHYLGQFEEPIYRRLEESCGFYNDHIVAYCRKAMSDDPRFAGLELPYGFRWRDINRASDAESLSPIPSSAPALDDLVNIDSSGTGGAKSATDAKPIPVINRTFYIASLVNTLDNQDPILLRRHMPRTGE